uniref:Uncharacterized protein n=1 Tax=Timspurckia oligopyrenoides TaxID=708627 RepID=A0A7S1EQ06_9RHOD|mmetsp:Transcript_10858/g.19637  ORF Transcript_10858/g.19637 Transcript_10858/m.19637 type:complete len:107 (+) Transcript_10858:55-375(+)
MRFVFCFVVAVVVFGVLCMTTVEARSKGHFGRFLRNKRVKCGQRYECLKVEEENFEACVLDCISSECYELIYSKNPLEDGEIDDERWNKFQQCVRATNFRSKSNQE